VRRFKSEDLNRRTRVSQAGATTAGIAAARVAAVAAPQARAAIPPSRLSAIKAPMRRCSSVLKQQRMGPPAAAAAAAAAATASLWVCHKALGRCSSLACSCQLAQDRTGDATIRQCASACFDVHM
jgi:hypothetical protein